MLEVFLEWLHIDDLSRNTYKINKAHESCEDKLKLCLTFYLLDFLEKTNCLQTSELLLIDIQKNLGLLQKKFGDNDKFVCLELEQVWMQNFDFSNTNSVQTCHDV